MSCDHSLVGKDCFCCSSVSKSCLILWDPKDCSMQGSSVLKYLPEFANSGPLSQSKHLTLCHSLVLLLSVFPSIRVFSSELALCIRWPKYWNFSFSINPSNEYSGLISFRIDWFDLLAAQGNLKGSSPTQVLDWGLLCCWQIFYHLSHQRSPLVQVSGV